ncbi:MAG TPA: PAS domain-containing protein [Rhizomicrobium sp.]|nr:PAS domain-containing protein [Rhizomicrobium sp.]
MSGFDFAAARDCLDRCSAAATKRLVGYWLTLWRGDQLPVRADFQPKAVGDLLPTIGIFEVVPGVSVRCRLVGSRLVEAAGGIDITGRDWLAMTEPDDRAERLNRFGAVASGGIGLGRRVAERVSGEVLQIEEVMLPFGDVAADGARQVLTHIAWAPTLYDPVKTGIARNSGLLADFRLIPLRNEAHTRG